MRTFKELSKTKKNLLYLWLAVLIITVFLVNSGYKLDPEAVYKSYEKEEGVSPAEIINVFPYGDDCVLMVGSSKQGITTVVAQKKLGLWKGTGCNQIYANEEYPLDFFYEPQAGVIYGSTWIEGAAQIYFEGRYSDIYENDVTGTAAVDENRCFVLDAGPYEHPKDAMDNLEKGGGSFYAELLDEAGNVIWTTDGQTRLR